MWAVSRRLRSSQPWCNYRGDTYRVIIMTPLVSFASFDRDVAASAGWAAIIKRIRNVITTRQSYALRATPTIDNPLPADETPTLMLVQFVSVALGREQDYLRVMMTDVLPHFDEAKMRHTSGALTFSGEGGYVHLFYIKNFAELDRCDLVHVRIQDLHVWCVGAASW